MSIPGGCQVPLSGDAGTGLCGWKTEGRLRWCSAHRRRRWLTGDFQGHVPVTRKPTREPGAVAARRAETATQLAEALRRRNAEQAAYLAQIEQHNRQTRAARRVTASLL